MKKLTDEEIQSLLETGQELPGYHTDAVTYQILFKVLGTPPNASLPLGFSAEVLRKVRARKQQVADIKLYILIALLSIFGFAGAFISVSMIDKQSAAQLTRVIIEYKGVSLFVIAATLLLHFSGRNRDYIS